MEIWKDIETYDGDYKISNYGRVLSLKRKKPQILSPQLDAMGYVHVRLGNGKDKQKLFKVHRLVASHFLSMPLLDKTLVNHLDKNKRNNHVLNLEWCSMQENWLHARQYDFSLIDLMNGKVKNPLDYV